MRELYLDPAIRAQVMEVLRKVCPTATVWAYGSRVTGGAHPGSDLDLAVQGASPARLKAAFVESDVPILVDVADWEALPPAWNVPANAILLYAGR